MPSIGEDAARHARKHLEHLEIRFGKRITVAAIDDFDHADQFSPLNHGGGDNGLCTHAAQVVEFTIEGGAETQVRDQHRPLGFDYESRDSSFEVELAVQQCILAVACDSEHDDFLTPAVQGMDAAYLATGD